MNRIYTRLLSIVENGKAGFFYLIDPDKLSLQNISQVVQGIQKGGCDAILVGGSFLFTNHFDDFIRLVKNETDLPVIIFPGNSRQISAAADAILFLNFISSRNPNYLIGEQVIAAPIIRSINLEAISTWYMQVESGNITTVEFLSGSRPIPRDKSEIAVAHALAAEYIGMKLVYLEGGSGAKFSIPDDMICKISEQINIPRVVGGGIRSAKEARAKVDAGADFVVIGNAMENNLSETFIQECAEAIHL